MKTGKYEADKLVSDHVELESGILGDELSEGEGNCCGRTWKCIRYELYPSPNGLIALCGGAMGLCTTLGIYLSAPRCPITKCSVTEESMGWLVPSIAFGGVVVFAALTKVMCVFADAVAGKRSCC